MSIFASLISVDVLAQEPDAGQSFSISVVGNARLSDNDISLLFSPDVALDPSDAKMNAIVRSLFGSGQFSDVSVSKTDEEIIIRVEEKPVVRNIAFEGNSAFKDDALAYATPIHADMPASDDNILAALESILEVYRRSGYFSATVDPFKIQRPDGAIDVVFEIIEGQRAHIHDIGIIGNKEFKDCEIRKALHSIQKGYVDYERATNEALSAETEDDKIEIMHDFLTRKLGFLTDRNLYNQDTIINDEILIRDLYLKNGYLDIEILSSTASLSDDWTKFFINYNLSEGKQYRFGKIYLDIKIPHKLNKADFTKVFPDLNGDIYNPEAVEEVLAALEDYLFEKNIFFASVRPLPERNEEGRTIDIRFEVTEGPALYIEEINISGNEWTLDRVIRSQLDFTIGDPFRAKEISKGAQKVRDLGFFAMAEFKVERGSAEHLVILNISVVEQPTGSLDIGLGYSVTQGPIFEIGYSEQNLMGKGQSLEGRAVVSADNGSFSAVFSLPEFEKDLGGANWGFSFRLGDGDDPLTPLMGMQLVFYVGYGVIRLPIIMLVLATGAYYCWLWKHDVARRRKRYRKTMRTVTAIAIIQVAVYLSSHLTDSIYEILSIATSEVAAETCA